MKKALYMLLALALIMSAACNDKPSRKRYIPKPWENLELRQSDTAYMKTGFYFFTGSEDGIRMRMEHSLAVYSLSRTPFVSVDNIKQAEIKTTKTETKEYIELWLTFDEKGTKDLEAGTGNPEHDQIAIVIAGRLLFVAENAAKIHTGVMRIVMNDYTPDEIIAMKMAIKQKR